MDEFREVLETKKVIYVNDVRPSIRGRYCRLRSKDLQSRSFDYSPSRSRSLLLCWWKVKSWGFFNVHSADLVESDLPPIMAFANQVSASWRKVNLLIDLEKSLQEKKLAEAELIKHRDHLEELVSTRTKELEEVNTELTNFAYVTSHDLKAPLRAISQLSTWIVEDYAPVLDQDGRDKLALLTNRTKHMHNLIDGILQYSRVGRVAEKVVDVDLNSLVQDTISLLNPPPNIQVQIEGKLPVVKAESTNITQVFQNLLSNAFKYMDKPQGKIKIGCKSDQDEWVFSIADNGPGIEEKYFEKIFQIFQTLGTSKDADSTGIGLALVKRIVEKWGGRIWLESTIGQGTIFFFSMPIKGGMYERKQTGSLVEDDEIDIMTLQRAMKELRVLNTLEVVHNGEEALEYLRNSTKADPCVILLDLNMPRMNGIEFLKKRGQDAAIKTIPVVVLTSSREEQDVVQSYRLGVAGYMIKPVDYKQFVETIRVIDLYWTSAASR